MWIWIQQSTFYFYIAIAFTLGMLIGAYLQSRAKFRLK